MPVTTTNLPTPPAIVIVVAHPGAARPGRHRRPVDHRGPRVPRRPRRITFLPRPARYVPLVAPGSRPAIHAGELALGVNVPKSGRWLCMGGHGRHGAG